MKLKPFQSLVNKYISLPYIGAETLIFYPIQFEKGYHLQSLMIIEMANTRIK